MNDAFIKEMQDLVNISNKQNEDESQKSKEYHEKMNEYQHQAKISIQKFLKDLNKNLERINNGITDIPNRFRIEQENNELSVTKSSLQFKIQFDIISLQDNFVACGLMSISNTSFKTLVGGYNLYIDTDTKWYIGQNDKKEPIDFFSSSNGNKKMLSIKDTLQFEKVPYNDSYLENTIRKFLNNGKK
jgi:RNase P subunit RPR2